MREGWGEQACSPHVERLLTFLPLVKRAPVRLEEPLTIVNNRCMYADVAGEATWVRKRMREGRGEQVWSEDAYLGAAAANGSFRLLLEVACGHAIG